MFNNLVGSIALVLGYVLQIAGPELNDGAVGRLAYQLLQKAGGVEQFELAAFIVRSPRGALSLLQWPNRGFSRANWVGPLPEGVVGVMHTHPQRSPRPSLQDRAEAMRLKLPFYVVSRGALCFASPHGEVHCAGNVPWHRRNGLAGEIALEWYSVV
jgi:hypothetical protein